MEKTAVVYGRGFEVLLGNERAQAAQMVIEQGGVEGGPGSHHEKATSGFLSSPGKEWPW